MRITFVGGGNMASALIGGLQARSGAEAPGMEFVVVDPSPQQRQQTAERFGVRTAATAADAMAGSDSGSGSGANNGQVVVFAVKPQQMRAAAEAVPALPADALVVTVAAGIRAADLSRWLGGHDRIVRAMPNTPALIGAGITGLFAGPSLDASDRQRAEAIVSAVGQVVWVEREADLDAITAVSGSGPAYVFYFIEALEAAARQTGLSAESARALALATFTGAAQLAAQSAESPATLRERVTSKGGTTAAALATLAAHDVAAIIGKAVEAARQRSTELGDEFGRD